ncbi:MAG TPA: DNA-3-methyladenine glycosylase [Nitrosomonas halophila]|nr:DNA-3-methyladenine glycosylase [Nitrosomonas halophila]
MAPVFWQQATQHLSASDPVMQRLIQRHGDVRLEVSGDAFSTLARAIVGQQISVKAAASVWQRMMVALPEVTPQVLAAVDADMLRACGLSARKVEFLRDLSSHFLRGGLKAVVWSEMDDEDLIAALTQVKGIGRWTAEMFLIFHLHRPDVLPLADVGLQRAVSIHYNASQPVSANRIRAIAGNWRPWRSVATWYLWRSLDPIPVIY